MRAVHVLASGVLVTAAVIGYGCNELTAETLVPAPEPGSTAGEIGAVCVPSFETAADFPGSNVSDLILDSHFDACGSGICLANHFQGRVSCPLGQAAPAPCADPGDAGCQSSNCQTASASAAENAGKVCCAEGSNTVVSTPVCGQCSKRSAAEAAYCSCRCGAAAGDPAADGGAYCGCPGGFECVELIRYIPGVSTPNAGSYCIKQGTEYPILDASPEQCGTVSGYFDPASCSGVAGN